ncbi:unnamed protein product [Camellia sinensis]
MLVYNMYVYILPTHVPILLLFLLSQVCKKCYQTTIVTHSLLFAMTEYREEDKPCCYFHPKEAIIGVCPLCLNERLLILAAKQGHRPQSESTTTNRRRKPSITLPKIFAFGSLLHRFDQFQNKQLDESDYDTLASASPEDSFISIRFEDNGVSSWEKGTVSTKASLDHCKNISWNHQSLMSKDSTKSIVVEHNAKPRGSLRWRKRIGHLFQLSRWRRSNRGGSVCHVGSKPEGVKVRSSGWIRTLTRRRTKE